MSTKNFTITIVRTGDFVKVSFTPQEKITNGQRTVIQRDDIRETLLNISDQLRTSNHHIRGVSDLPKAQEPSDYVGWDFHTNQPIHRDAAKQAFWSTKVAGKYNFDEWLARKNGVSEETSDQPDRDFFNIWTSGADSNPLTALWAVMAEKLNKESLGESSHESIKETIKPVDKQPPVATLPKTDEEGAKKFNPRPSSPDVSLGNIFIYTFSRMSARELNTALNKISEAFNGNFVSVRYKAGDTLSLPVHRNVFDYYSRVVSTLLNAVPANNIGLVLPVVSEFIHAGKVDILVAALESSYLCAHGLLTPRRAVPGKQLPGDTGPMNMTTTATKTYEGTKRVHACPMTRGEYNAYRGWEVPADENPADDGYLVEYLDGGKSNHPDHAGYISWSPKDVFERAYSEVGQGLSFGDALKALKAGRRVARTGWNGKGMWLSLSCAPGGDAAAGRREIAAENLWSSNNSEYARQNGGSAVVLPCITMKTTTGEILMGWLASQTDMLAEDWEVLA